MDADDLNLESFRLLIPDINRLFPHTSLSSFKALHDPRVFSLHAQFDPRLQRVVYLVRDPRDVLVSYYHHHRRRDIDFRMSISDFIAANQFWPGDWGEHVTGWLQNDGADSILFVRYEDLKSDPLAWFRRIAHHVQLDAPDPIIEQAISLSSFSNMRRLEQTFGMPADQSDPSLPFVRKGRVGGWQDELDPETVRLIESRYRYLFDVFEFETSGGTAGVIDAR
jgi:hypothetical protein